MRYLLDISYKGTNYHGWQIQDNASTVQEVLEKALTTILGKQIHVIGSGRTDTGVHAGQQIVHFDFTELRPEELTRKLNSFLPVDISINRVKHVNEEFHARFSANQRTYHYFINRKKKPFLQETSYYFNTKLDADLIKEACEIIKSWQNFECFSKVHTEVNNFNCEIFEADWVSEEDTETFLISANRFLRGMVRAIVGTLLDVGTRKTSISEFKEILKSGDRNKAGRAVPAHGLFLQEVSYPDELLIP